MHADILCRARRAGAALSLLLIAVALAGCLPSRFVIELDPPAKLVERTMVEGDRSRKIALITVDGIIADAPLPSVFGQGPNPVDELVRRLNKAEQDPQVKGVVVRVNSPGGTVTGSETMYREIHRFRETTGKPVVVAMGEVAASGGYYISLAGDEIMAMPTTTTGSIGVLLQTVNVSKGLSMIGVEARALTSGPNKDLANPLEPIEEHHYEILQSTVDEMYERFRGLVVERRPDLEDVEIATDGRIVTGQRALELGLVDRMGSVRDAHQRAQELAGVDGASMVVYTFSGKDILGSPYGPQSRGGQAPLAAANVQMLNLAPHDILRTRPGFYYIWTPGLP